MADPIDQPVPAAPGLLPSPPVPPLPPSAITSRPAGDSGDSNGDGRIKRWLVTILKLAIAVVGIWYVLHNIRWHDWATIPGGGRALRGVAFVADTDVRVVAVPQEPGRGGGPNAGVNAGAGSLVRIRFPDVPVKIRVPVRATGEEREVEMVIAEHATIPGTQEELNIPNELDIDVAMLKEVSGVPNRVHEELYTTLRRASSRWYFLLGAWLLLGIPFLVTSIRWRNLMRPQGIEMGLGKCLQLTFVGQFYSIMLPGITGGDLVKIVYAARLTGSKTKSFITIILDRVIGLVALMTIAGTSAGVQLLLNRQNGAAADNTLLNVFVMITVLLAMLAAGATVYFSHRLRRLVGIEWFVEHFGAADSERVQHEKMEHLFRVLNVLSLIIAGGVIAVLAALRWGVKLPWAQHNTVIVFGGLVGMGLLALGAAAGLVLHGAMVHRMAPVLRKAVAAMVRVDETLHVYRGHFGLLVWAFVISLISQMTLPLSAWLSGQAFGMTAPLTHYLAYVPVAVLAASLPISPPQGIGVMDWLILHFFSEKGAARAGQAFALTQAIRFLPMLWNLFGAYWVVTGSYSRQKVQAQERELEEGRVK